MRGQHAVRCDEGAHASAEDELGEFSYALAHDLSSEFRHVAEFAKLITRDVGVESPAALRNAQIVAATAQKCQAMLDAIVVYSLVQRRPLLLKSCKGEALVERALHEAEQEPGVHPALIAVDVSGHPFGDEYLIACALRLIIANALQFRVHNVEHKLTIRGGVSDDGGWRFRVDDNGVGLAPQHREKAFGMFWRLDPQRSSAGVGSGLAIVRRIVRRHGGEARFLECANGAAFELWLPGKAGQ